MIVMSSPMRSSPSPSSRPVTKTQGRRETRSTRSTMSRVMGGSPPDVDEGVLRPGPPALVTRWAVSVSAAWVSSAVLRNLSAVS